MILFTNRCKQRKRAALSLFAFLALSISALHAEQTSTKKASTSTADHTKFEELQQVFAKGPDVTKACLSCHTEASKQIHNTTHWNWKITHPETGQVLGKHKVVNSFCGSIVTNYARCTSCHIGYGWKDDSFDFASQENVDCLVCHDTTDTYKKYPTDAGHPAYEDKLFPPKKGKKLFKAPDLAYVAQNVGLPRRENCGVCHFYGGGGDGVKHGDLDSSMTNPSRELDVHLGKDGLNFVCTECHTTDGHDLKGSHYVSVGKDKQGIDIPGRTDNSRASCESCHGLRPHPETVNDKINDHTNKIACQTCHIPYFAKGGVPSKIWWDWSTAGRKTEDGKPISKKDDKGNVIYDTKKGSFEWGENLKPEYDWFAGDIQYMELDEKFDPNSVIQINKFSGSYDDPDARIWPFKVMRGKQPYDKGNNTLVITHLFGKDADAYWKSFDWNRSIKAAMDAAGAKYSGEYGFIETTMHWPLSHMVAPKEEALGCDECHSKNGRLQNLTGFYMPGRDKSDLLDLIGWLAVLATFGFLALHGLGRLAFRNRRKG